MDTNADRVRPSRRGTPWDGGTGDDVGSELDNIAEIGTGARQHDTDILKRLTCLCRRVASPHRVSVGVHTPWPAT